MGTCDEDTRLATHARAKFTTYDAALARLKRTHPKDAGVDGPLERLDDAVRVWGHAAFEEGMRFALEADVLRRSLLAMATEANDGT